MDRHEGGCLCGAVRYVCEGPLREVVYCHCSQCRRQTGLYYAATSFARSALWVRDAQGALRWYAASTFARRGFCGTCGSALFWEPLGGANVAILAGSFDQPASLVPGYHICTEGRATFYAIADGLAQHSGGAAGVVIAGG